MAWPADAAREAKGAGSRDRRRCGWRAKRGKHYAAVDFDVLANVAACLAATSGSIRT